MNTDAILAVAILLIGYWMLMKLIWLSIKLHQAQYRRMILDEYANLPDRFQ